MIENHRLISFEPRRNGAPPDDFVYRSLEGEQTCPMQLPASGREVVILRDRPSVVASLTDPRFSLARATQDFPVTGAVFQSQEGLLRRDPPGLTVIRQEIAPFFTPRNIEKWRPEAERSARALARSLSSTPEPIDLNRAFCEPFVTEAVSLTTGIPLADCPRVFSLVERNLSLVETPEDQHQITESWRELYDYANGLLADKRKQPDGSILSDVVTALDQKGMTQEQVLHACGTIITGFPTALPVFSVSAVELLTHPEVVADCKEKPELWPAVADEAMRRRAHFAFALPRVAMADVPIGDETIAAGQVVVPSLTAAILDPNYTDDPENFDPLKKAKRNLVFGAGPHFCPGAALSRQWMEVGLRELFTELPNLRLAVPEQELPWQKGTLSMPERIPVISN